jgi:hypothetical protein
MDTWDLETKSKLKERGFKIASRTSSDTSLDIHSIEAMHKQHAIYA